MKKLLSLIILISIFGCQHKTKKITDLEKSNLKGKIHKVIFRQFFTEIKDGLVTKKEIEVTENISYVTLSIDEYNRNGMLKKQTQYEDYELSNITEYQYEDDELISKEIYNKDGDELLLKILYRYINDSLPNKKFILETPVGNEHMKTPTLKEVNEKGKVINAIHNPFDSYFRTKITYGYNKDNKLSEIRKYGYGNILRTKENYIYNEKGEIEKYELLSNNNTLIIYEISHGIKYDKKGNLIYFSVGDSIKPRSIYEYIYEYY